MRPCLSPEIAQGNRPVDLCRATADDRRMLRFLPVLALLLPCAAAERPWTDDVLYFLLTDRFHDGDPANNVPAGSDPELHDSAQKDRGKYHGGDLRGLELAIRAGYFNELGVTALWITPPVRNVWRSGPDGKWSCGYHGYWAQDFLDIDPHLTSATALDGRAYPEGVEGRMQHYRDLVALAHSKGLKIVQDVVLNHAGPVFYYDTNGDGRFDSQALNEWELPFRADGYHGNAVWADLPRWNLRRTMPGGPQRLLGREIATGGVLAELSSYGRKGCSGPGSLGAKGGEEIECDFFTLRDLWTTPGSAHFDRLVNEFVEIYAFYLLDVGVDGLRIDTVKHVHHPFWDAFTERLRKRLGSQAKDKLFFGEVYDHDPKKLGAYTWRSDWPVRKDPCLDSMLDFDLCHAARSYLRREGDAYGNAREIEQAMEDRQAGEENGKPFYNPNPGADGMNACRKSVSFIENHDDLNRFRVKDVAEARSNLAQALVMSLPGIPCIYYGAEICLQDQSARVGEESETGRLTLFPRDSAPVLANLRERESFKTIARMAKLRREITALRSGRFEPLWVDSPGDGSDDGVFAFSRVDGAERVMVILNASTAERKPALPTRFAAGTWLRAEGISTDVRSFVVGGNGVVTIPISAGNILICRPETPP
jgi:alpha-amylase